MTGPADISAIHRKLPVPIADSAGASKCRTMISVAVAFVAGLRELLS